MGKDNHHLSLLPYFFALLGLTAVEVGLYEAWRAMADENGQSFVPKYVIVLIILAFTIPKAGIVMTYFMHLRYEKQLLIMFATTPLIIVFIAVLPTLSDIKTLKPNLQNQQQQITGFGPHKPMKLKHHDHQHGPGEHKDGKHEDKGDTSGGGE